MQLFNELERVNERPEPFSCYTARELWTNDHTSEHMLAYHLNESVNISSRNTAFIDASVAWIVKRFRIQEGTRVVDFGCGPGLYAARFANAGASVTGIDFSPRSIAYARERATREGHPITYVLDDYLTYEAKGEFDVITMIMCDYCALSPKQRSVLLRKFERLLAPAGVIILDVYSHAAYAKREEVAMYEKNLLNGFWSKDDYYGFLTTFKYDDARAVLDKYTIATKEEVREVYNWLAYFSPEQIEDEFSKEGLTVVEYVADVAGGAFSPEADEFAVVATKKR